MPIVTGPWTHAASRVSLPLGIIISLKPRMGFSSEVLIHTAVSKGGPALPGDTR